MAPGDLGRLKASLAFLAGFCGLLFISFKDKAERFQNNIEDISDTLGDKATYFNLFQEIILAEDKSSFTRKEISNLIDDWLYHSESAASSGKSNKDVLKFSSRALGIISDGIDIKKLVMKIGPNEFTSLLIAKGIEKGMLKESMKIIEKKVQIEYSLNIESK